VLQALRPQFPKAIFFTIDLDRRLVQPSNYQWTRNLLVGSGYGFELNAGLQKNIPPFRDVYQTSTFLATQLALSPMQAVDKQKALKGWLRLPRVYEIGRTQAFALQPQSEENGTPQASDSFANRSLAKIARVFTRHTAAPDRCDTLAGCKDIRPPLPGLFPHSPLWVWIVVCGAFGFLMALLYRYSWGIRRAVDAPWQSAKASSVIAIGILSVALLVVIVIANAEHGEPFAWAEGISLWPTQLIRLLALLLCVFFIFRVLRPGEKVQKEIHDEFFPGALNVAGTPVIDKYHGKLFKWFDEYPEPSPSIDAGKLWGEYRALDTWRARKHRLWFPALCYFAVCVGLINAFGGLPNTPYRDEVSLWVNFGLILMLAIAFIVLLFSVIDSIRLCSTFIRNLTKGRSDYPPETIEKFRNSLYFDSLQPGCYMCDWIDIRLIAQLTERIGEQVYYPFIVLALMLVARSPLFDYWHTPMGLILVFVLGFALAIACAVVLQRVAERARAIALERMTHYLAQAKGEQPPNNALVAQLGMLLDEVKNLHRGAFVPFLQQFLVRAVMVPVGSFGGLQLVEYFVLAWYL
jgi:hypothetical protein